MPCCLAASLSFCLDSSLPEPPYLIRPVAMCFAAWKVDFRVLYSPLLSFVRSGFLSPASLPLLPARLSLIVGHLLLKRCLSAVGFGKLEARFCTTASMTAFFREFSSSSDNTIFLPLPIFQVCSGSSLSVSSALECYRMIVEWVALVLWNPGLVCYVLMVLISFDSTLLPCSGILVAFVRPFTAVCSVFTVVYSVLTAIEEKLNITSPPVIQVPSGICLPVTSFMELFLFPIFPPLLSGLDVQASLVLQDSSSRLMVFSAYDAVFVTFWVALDAVFQEVHEIVLVFRFFMAFYELYCQSIFWHLLLCFHVFSFLLVVLATRSIEFEASK
ncbi:hypothetical protein EUTSA_v10028196mg [Eutrema salsugineum]|uniref:Uncharacterized protein n=1 Tax=Eutrema salsugineum TaxID=72664 RepID=V4LTQ6_EUTSA|nr:hypothetical protein EUTSA_v10028196mg [Eutrema salsugineum]